MLEEILKYERNAFFFLNGSDSPFLDHFMWLFSGKIVWIPLALIIICTLAYKKNWRETVFILLAIALTITLCDQFASHICKPIFHRFRPTHHPDFMEEVKVVFGYRGGRYGFISSHAANAFGFATLLALIFKNKLFTWMIFIWATITAYTRIYLGVHFISDIIPGIISGIVFGFFVYWLYKKLRSHFLKTSSNVQLLYSPKTKNFLAITIGVYILMLLVFTEPIIYLTEKF